MSIISIKYNANNRWKRSTKNKDKKYPIVKVWELNDFVMQLNLIFSN